MLTKTLRENARQKYAALRLCPKLQVDTVKASKIVAQVLCGLNASSGKIKVLKAR